MATVWIDIPDTDSPDWDALSDPGARGDLALEQRNIALGLWVRLTLWSSNKLTGGFLTEAIVDEYGSPDSTPRLLRSQLGVPPRLHRRGDGSDCPCLQRLGAWPAGYEYAIHDFDRRLRHRLPTTEES